MCIRETGFPWTQSQRLSELRKETSACASGRLASLGPRAQSSVRSGRDTSACASGKVTFLGTNNDEAQCRACNHLLHLP